MASNTKAWPLVCFIPHRGYSHVWPTYCYSVLVRDTQPIDTLANAKLTSNKSDRRPLLPLARIVQKTRLREVLSCLVSSSLPLCSDALAFGCTSSTQIGLQKWLLPKTQSTCSKMKCYSCELLSSLEMRIVSSSLGPLSGVRQCTGDTKQISISHCAANEKFVCHIEPLVVCDHSERVDCDIDGGVGPMLVRHLH